MTYTLPAGKASENRRAKWVPKNKQLKIYNFYMRSEEKWIKQVPKKNENGKKRCMEELELLIRQMKRIKHSLLTARAL